MINLFKAAQVKTTNPISGILEIIPYTESVLDYELLDKLNLVLRASGYGKYVTNTLVIMLLASLRRLKRIINGQ